MKDFVLNLSVSIGVVSGVIALASTIYMLWTKKKKALLLIIVFSILTISAILLYDPIKDTTASNNQTNTPMNTADIFKTENEQLAKTEEPNIHLSLKYNYTNSITSCVGTRFAVGLNNYIYHVGSPEDNWCLYRTDDSNKKEVVSTYSSTNFAVSDNRLIFGNDGIQTADFSGQDITRIYNGIVHGISCIDNWIYFIEFENNSNHLKRISVDGKRIEDMNIIVDTYSYVVGDEGIYNISSDNMSICLYKNGIKNKIITSKSQIFDMLYYEGILYYKDDFGIHKVNPVDINDVVIPNTEDCCFYFTIVDDNMNGRINNSIILYSTGYAFYLITTSGDYKTLVVDNNSSDRICVVGNWIYYYKTFDGNSDGSSEDHLYRMESDGSNDQPVN